MLPYLPRLEINTLLYFITRSHVEGIRYSSGMVYSTTNFMFITRQFQILRFVLSNIKNQAVH